MKGKIFMAVKLKGRNFEIVASAVVFDKDGTLTQGMRVWRKIFEKQMEVSKEMNLKIEDRAKEIFGVEIDEPYIPLAIAYSSEEKTLLAASIWLSHHLPWDKCRETASQIVKKALEKMSDDELFEPVKGAKEAIEKISKNVPVAIATSDSKENVKHLLKNWNLESNVSYVITSSEVKEGKPAPYMLQKICEFFDLKCSQILMIGDNEVDVEMAKRAGTKIVSVGRRLNGVDGWIENFEDLEISRVDS